MTTYTFSRSDDVEYLRHGDLEHVQKTFHFSWLIQTLKCSSPVSGSSSMCALSIWLSRMSYHRPITSMVLRQLYEEFFLNVLAYGSLNILHNPFQETTKYAI